MTQKEIFLPLCHRCKLRRTANAKGVCDHCMGLSRDADRKRLWREVVKGADK